MIFRIIRISHEACGSRLPIRVPNPVNPDLKLGLRRGSRRVVEAASMPLRSKGKRLEAASTTEPEIRAVLKCIVSPTNDPAKHAAGGGTDSKIRRLLRSAPLRRWRATALQGASRIAIGSAPAPWSAAVLCRLRCVERIHKFHHRFGRNTDYFHAAWSPRLRGIGICLKMVRVPLLGTPTPPSFASAATIRCGRGPASRCAGATNKSSGP